VTIELGRTATAADVKTFGADSVIVATGGSWRVDESAFASAGRLVAVLGSDVPALGLAEFHARRGANVAVLRRQPRWPARGARLPGRFRGFTTYASSESSSCSARRSAPIEADTIIDARAVARRAGADGRLRHRRRGRDRFVEARCGLPSTPRFAVSRT